MLKQYAIGDLKNLNRVRSPKALMDQVHLKVSDSSSISVRVGAVLIEPVERPRTLEDLLEGFESGEILGWGEL